MRVGQLFVTPEAWPRIQTSETVPSGLSATGTPAECVRRVGLHFPGIWARLDRLRASCLDGVRAMPDHWYLPFDAVMPVLDEVLEEMVQAGVNVGTVPGATVNMLSTLAGWRCTQGIYRFDPTLYDALIATPVEGKLPTELLSRLPEWTVYIETPGLRWANEPMRGVFAQVGNLPGGAESLTLVAHLENADRCVSGVCIRLDQATIEASLEAVYSRRATAGMAFDGLDLSTLHRVVPGVLSLLLYLCSETAEVGHGTRLPSRPAPRRTKKGTRMFPAERQTDWDVGVRLGTALRRAATGERRTASREPGCEVTTMLGSLSRRARMSLAVLSSVATLVGMAALSFLLANFSPAQPRPSKPPRQVIYRFDDHRWLELRGWNCEGALWYFDSRQGIKTEVSPQFFRISFFTYIHPSERYVAIPYNDMSALMVSRDGGRTFNDARIAVGFGGKYDGQRPRVDDVSRLVVVDDQGFLETNSGRLLETSKPFGERWGLDYIDYLAQGEAPNLTLYARPNFRDMPRAIPEVKNYRSWTHMKCDPNVGEDTGRGAFR